MAPRSAPPMGEELLSPAQAAEILGVSTDTLARWADSGRLPAVRIVDNAHRRYPRQAIEELLSRRLDQGGPKR